ncbi:tRNA (adenosine(37)-N6)-threonylcarbamoyltransferase complex ATPase subunit type 1 TsaE [Heliophilum fasciatum]|uniref:tRNA threonylcarbamoyladenosine biosynthesis protein TsaE n=1 Tax=Heliophilum fasciatum TaxID=35700 RepID=A0A4R2SCN8_9FIRM|nr:tRNA (adenosine(37)-N6)-threonylcarbamoyltransferase complex ATPase subunit type 1 TsaE [Heliophilum fasciatum]MCW2276704.1 tRNA threonylcarbamoyladenosine biosynthesis protein TsaE [Heliophilum fasciatum]TCP68915.1 tRNA threonylcarbamoyladenosine biosynthesis protein TsaE [Heliophilum fasciatum]
MQAILPDEVATKELGTWLGQRMQAGDTLWLHGDLGAGKTTLVRGLAEGLGITDRVTSPTFTFVHEFAGRLPFYHFDLYRLDDPEEVWDLGWSDYLGGQGVVAVEWPERLGENWPMAGLHITLTPVTLPDGSWARALTLESQGDEALRFLKELRATCSSLDWIVPQA